MALLGTHLEQIEFCASTISELPFPSPGIFTNALLNPPDITALIRDPDAHESALFQVIPPTELTASDASNNVSGRRNTMINSRHVPLDTPITYTELNRRTAVSTVLGADMAERIRRQRAGDSAWTRRRTGVAKDEVDIELLLRGAEKLCKAYPLPGALDRIAALRARHETVERSIAQFERLTGEQSEQLKKLSRSNSFAADDIEQDDIFNENHDSTSTPHLTAEDLKREEDLVKELERRKRVLEERVDGMKKDIGGILR